MERKKYDLIIIGWGKAGKSIAAKMGTLGKKLHLLKKTKICLAELV